MIDNLEGAEQILAILPQMNISLDDISNQLANEDIARSSSAFNQLLNTIDQKRNE